MRFVFLFVVGVLKLQDSLQLIPLIMKSPKVVVVGAGAAGIAATARLLENGVTDVTVLEAENRIGGRIHSVNFGTGVVDLGAQWCHGEEDNIVYNLVKDLNLLGPSFQSYDDFTLYESSGKVVPKALSDKLAGVAFGIMADEEALAESEESFGEFFISRYNREIEEECGDDPDLRKISSKVLNTFHKFVLAYDASPTWFDFSAKGSVQYKECSGDKYLHWKDKGYKAILDVLMKKIPDPTEQLPVADKIVLNKEIRTILWKDAASTVTVECSDGSRYSADHVIVTLPLGVLKDKTSLFHPELPIQKQNAIKGLGFGTMVKLFLHFPVQWWPSTTKGFTFMWNGDEDVLNDFPYGPCKDGKSWLQDVLGFYIIDSQPNVLLGWLVGPQAAQVESLSDDILLDGCMYLLRKFAGREYDIPYPKQFISSLWNSNEHFRGTYSYRSMDSERMNVTAEDLSEPMYVNNKPALLFAGEATHSYYYSTVHGAIETGFREADRIINIYNSFKAKL